VVLPWSTWAMIATLRRDIQGIRLGRAMFAAQYKQRRPNRND